MEETKGRGIHKLCIQMKYLHYKMYYVIDRIPSGKQTPLEVFQREFNSENWLQNRKGWKSKREEEQRVLKEQTPEAANSLCWSPRAWRRCLPTRDAILDVCGVAERGAATSSAVRVWTHPTALLAITSHCGTTTLPAPETRAFPPSCTSNLQPVLLRGSI